MHAPKARGLVSGLFETVGRWEGVAEAHPEGVVVTGEHIWHENDRERRDAEDTGIPWATLENATLKGKRLELKPKTPSMIFMIAITDFDQQGVEPWLRLLEENGIRVDRKDASST